MRSSRALSEYESWLLNEVPHLSLTYEDNIRDPDAHQKTVDEICSFLGVESAPIESSYEKTLCHRCERELRIMRN